MYFSGYIPNIPMVFKLIQISRIKAYQNTNTHTQISANRILSKQCILIALFTLKTKISLKFVFSLTMILILIFSPLKKSSILENGAFSMFLGTFSLRLKLFSNKSCATKHIILLQFPLQPQRSTGNLEIWILKIMKGQEGTNNTLCTVAL